MHITTLRLVAIASFAFSFAAHADCAFPKAPASIPDGKSASEAEMLAAMQAFKEYNEEVNAFAPAWRRKRRAKPLARRS